MHRNVLVTLDGTEVSEAVLPEVVRLARGTETTVTLLRVAGLPKVEPAMEPAAVGGVGTLGSEQRRRQSRETLDQAMERLKLDVESYLEEKAKVLRAEGISVDCAVQFADEPGEAIEQYSRASDAELVVMATHARRGIARLFSGSVAERVLERGVRPVLLVHPTDA